MNKHHVLLHQFFVPAIYVCPFSRSMFLFNQLCMYYLWNPPPLQLNWYRTYIILAAFSGFSLWTPTYRLLHSSFWCKGRNNRGIENWVFKTLYVWLHPQPFPGFRHFIFILKSRTNLLVKKTCKQIKNLIVNM